MIVTYTWAELEAHRLVNSGRFLTSNSDFRKEANEACDYIISLAERIKSSRAQATMQYAAQAAGR